MRIIVNLTLLLGLIIIVQCKNEIIKEEKETIFFEIHDTLLINKSPDLHKNVDIKHGFKNIFLGTNIHDYKFDKNWENYYKYKIIRVYSSILGNPFEINGTSLRKITLVFFEDKLVLIKVFSDERKTKEGSCNNGAILKTLMMLYGQSITFNIKEDDLDFYEIGRGIPFCPGLDIKKYITLLDVKGGKGKFPDPEILKSDLCKKVAFEIINSTKHRAKWEGESTSIIYSSNCKYYMDYSRPAIKKDYKSKYNYGVTEHFTIYNHEIINTINQYIKTEKNKYRIERERERENIERQQIDKL